MKLTQEKADQIREIHRRGGITQEELGRRFSVCDATIGQVVRGDTWTGRDSRAKLSPSEVRVILRRVQNGDRQIDVAADYGVSKQTVNAIVKGRRWSRLERTTPNE